ncbi:YHS domain protein [Maritimibacter sp. 55A14]|nr:YHS domain protein [Maritimibacter sp. 55A14]
MIAGGTAFAVAGVALALRRCVFERVAGFKELPPTPIFMVEGLAIRGTDTVAYFREGRPVVGDAAFETEWNGARWRFASAENRDDFLAAPERFAPQYGGFCAWAVAARGELYSTQPRNWSIVDSRLYLNFNDKIQRRWESDIPGFIAEADRRWPEIAASIT